MKATDMNPKEKAKELVDRFGDHVSANELGTFEYNAKQCALICVDFTLSIGVSPNDTKELLEIKSEINSL